MKSRVLTGVIGSVIVTAWLLLMFTPVFSIVISVLSVIAAHEMLKAFSVKNPVFKGLCFLIAAAIPLYAEYKSKLDLPLFPVITAVVIISLIISVLDFKKLSFEQVACSLASCTLIPSALSCIVLFRDLYVTYEGAYTKVDGIFFIIFIFIASWGSDTFAFFAGKFFGKHKLAPVISPKKTIEGAIGGTLCSTLVNVGLYFLFNHFFTLSSNTGFVLVLIASPVLSVISIFGDLAASTIKRHHGIKDFGNLLPGHGGIMDRFDSTCFVLPVLYSIITVVNAI